MEGTQSVVDDIGTAHAAEKTEAEVRLKRTTMATDSR
jgi:hypothetical protein